MARLPPYAEVSTKPTGPIERITPTVGLSRPGDWIAKSQLFLLSSRAA